MGRVVLDIFIGVSLVSCLGAGCSLQDKHLAMIFVRPRPRKDSCWRTGQFFISALPCHRRLQRQFLGCLVIVYLRSILQPLLTAKNTGMYFTALRASYESRVALLSIEARQHSSSEAHQFLPYTSQSTNKHESTSVLAL